MLIERARQLGATALRRSWRQGKKFAILYEGRWIHFGSTKYDDYTVHRDEKRRASYRARHGAIKTKDGRLARTVKTSPAYWSWELLW